MLFKTVVFLLFATNLLYVECRPQEEVIPVYTVKQILFKDSTFNNIINSIWQYISSHYITPVQGVVDCDHTPAPTASPGNTNVIGINEEVLRTKLFNSELIEQLLQEITSEYINSHPDGTAAPFRSTIRDEEALRIAFKIALFNSQSFNNFIQNVLQQISLQYENIQNPTLPPFSAVRPENNVQPNAIWPDPLDQPISSGRIPQQPNIHTDCDCDHHGTGYTGTGNAVTSRPTKFYYEFDSN